MYMKINFVNPDHVHALIDLPTGFSIEKVVQLLKGSSSHWVNSSELVTGKFAWAEAMDRSRYRIPMWIWWRDTSPIRKNIIANARLPRNCENSSIVTGCVGMMKEAVETANDVYVRSTGLKAGVNEKGSYTATCAQDLSGSD